MRVNRGRLRYALTFEIHLAGSSMRRLKVGDPVLCMSAVYQHEHTIDGSKRYRVEAGTRGVVSSVYNHSSWFINSKGHRQWSVDATVAIVSFTADSGVMFTSHINVRALKRAPRR
jgi:hypothetical protein